MNRSSNGWKTEAVVVSCIVIAAVVIRWLPYNACFAADRTYFSGPDSYYHLRRVLMATVDFWQLPHIDYYMGFPQGTPDRVSPLMYLLVSGISWLAAGGSLPAQNVVEIVSAVIPPFWGALCLVPVYLLARQLAGPVAGYAAAAGMAVMPDFVLQTLLGCFDNNGLEPILAALYFLAVSQLLPASGDSSPHKAGRSFGNIAVAGITGWIALFTWRGTIMFFAFVGMYCLSELLLAGFRQRLTRPVLKPVGLSFIIIGLLTLPLVMAGVWGAQPTFQFNVVSWFHLLALFGGGVSFLLLAQIPESWFKSSRSGSTMGVLVLIMTAGAVLYVLSHKKGGGDVTLYNYLFAFRNPWEIAELQGLFRQDNAWSLSSPSRALTYGVWLFPLVWLAVAWQELRREVPQSRMLLFLVWSLGLFAVAVVRVRFTPLASLGVAVALGLLSASISEMVIIPGREVGRAARHAGAILVFLLLLIPSWRLIVALPHYTYKIPVTDDLFDALDWIRGNSPVSTRFDMPWQQPDYGILARWDFGHWINYIARRPAVATPMLTETYGIEPLARFVLTENNEEAEQILRDNRIKYVISTNVLRGLSAYAAMINVKTDAFLEETTDSTGQVVDNVKPGWFRLLSTRMLFNDGLSFSANDALIQPPQHLRLVYESKGDLDVRGFANKVSPVKVFEYVPGAQLQGITAPGTRVSAVVTIRTNQGRTFVWKTTAVSRVDGSYAIVAPYASDSGEPVYGITPYLVKTVSGERLIDVNREAVVQGNVITVSR